MLKEVGMTVSAMAGVRRGIFGAIRGTVVPCRCRCHTSPPPTGHTQAIQNPPHRAENSVRDDTTERRHLDSQHARSLLPFRRKIPCYPPPRGSGTGHWTRFFLHDDPIRGIRAGKFCWSWKWWAKGNPSRNVFLPPPPLPPRLKSGRNQWMSHFGRPENKQPCNRTGQELASGLGVRVFLGWWKQFLQGWRGWPPLLDWLISSSNAFSWLALIDWLIDGLLEQCDRSRWRNACCEFLLHQIIPRKWSKNEMTI